MSGCFWDLNNEQSNNQLIIHVNCSEVNKLRCELIQYQKACTNQVSMTLSWSPIVQRLDAHILSSYFQVAAEAMESVVATSNNAMPNVRYLLFFLYTTHNHRSR